MRNIRIVLTLLSILLGMSYISKAQTIYDIYGEFYTYITNTNSDEHVYTEYANPLKSIVASSDTYLLGNGARDTIIAEANNIYNDPSIRILCVKAMVHFNNQGTINMLNSMLNIDDYNINRHAAIVLLTFNQYDYSVPLLESEGCYQTLVNYDVPNVDSLLNVGYSCGNIAHEMRAAIELQKRGQPQLSFNKAYEVLILKAAPNGVDQVEYEQACLRAIWVLQGRNNATDITYMARALEHYNPAIRSTALTAIVRLSLPRFCGHREKMVVSFSRRCSHVQSQHVRSGVQA